MGYLVCQNLFFFYVVGVFVGNELFDRRGLFKFCVCVRIIHSTLMVAMLTLVTLTFVHIFEIYIDVNNRLCCRC